MAESDKPPKTIGDLIDHLEMIREELLGLQRSLEKMENIDFLLADVQKKGFRDDGRLRWNFHSELQEQFKPLLPKVAPVQASFQNS
jgi:hypothetical protein